MFTALLIFLAYTIFFLFILYRISLKKSFALSFNEAAFAFIIKIAAGCFYGYFFLHYYGGDDTWLYHNEALKEYALLKNNPLHFFDDLIPNGYSTNQFLTIFNSTGSFAKDLEITLLLKLLALFDLLSGGRYYVNIIFYDALVFCGSYCLFKVMNTKYPDKKQLWLVFIFYFPPLLFWTSGIRKDGLCFALFCWLIYQLFILAETKYSVKNIAYVIGVFILLFLFRNYAALSFIPVIIAYTLTIKSKRNSVAIFAFVFFCCMAVFFLTGFLPVSFNLPLKMAERQQAFSQLSGNSHLQLTSLKGTFYSYATNFFEALNHVFIRPYFSEAKGILYIFSFGEIAFFFFLLLRMILKPAPQLKKIINDPLILSFIMIAFLNYIIIGYTVPFLGAIVRYKASFEIFFLLAFLCLQNNIVHFKIIKTKKAPDISETSA